jgi:hypothetical protein
MGKTAAKRIRRSAARRGVLPDDPLSIARIARSITSLTAVGALLSTLLFAGRVLVVARFDLDVAAALLSNTSLTMVVQAVTLQLFPFLSYLGGVAALYAGGYRLAEQPRRGRVAGGGLILAIAGLPFVLPLVLTQQLDNLLVAGIVGLLIPLAAFAFGLRRRRIADLGVTFAIPLAFVTVTSVVSALVSGLWLAPETAKMDGAVETVIYTLASDGSDLVVFSPGDHAVIRLHDSSVTDRQYCRNRSDHSTLAERLFRQPTIPKCPAPRQTVRS